MKFIIFFIYMPFVYSERRRFITTYTGINGSTIAGIPEFSAVTTLDDQQIDYYDSNTMELIPKQDWIKDFASTRMWKQDTKIRKHVQQIYKNNIHALMKRFSQSHGVHTYQRMYGCEWDDHTGDSQGFDQYGYDGEDFISLDLKQFRYIASVQQGFPTVQKWNNDRTQIESLKQYYEDECVYWLKEFLALRKEDLERRAPEVFLLKRNLSSPVVCHATGFFPSGISITWLRNGVNHNKHVSFRQTLPNEDGTFQKSATLNVTSDEWKKNQYTCEVEHQGKTIQKILTEDEIKSNNRPIAYFTILVCVIIGVFAVLVIGAAVCIYKYLQEIKEKFEPVPSESEERIDKSY